MTLDLRPAADEMARVVGGISDDQLGLPTPCGAATVGNVLAHVVGLTVAFRDCARKDSGPTTETPPTITALDLPDDWRAILPGQLAEMADAWERPEAWEGESTVGGVTSPAAQNGMFANDELVVHAWDLAVSTGQTTSPADANLRACYELASGIPADSPARSGLFGPTVPVPEDAPLLDRAVAATGRNPRWQPPA